MNIDTVDAAEKEASEVLHSLLSVERIEKPVSSQLHEPLQQQVLVVNCKSENYQQRSTVDRQQWNNSLPETVFNTLRHSEDFHNSTWKSSPSIISLDVDQSLTQDAPLETIPSSNDAEENNQENYELIKNKRSSDDSHSQTNEKSPKMVKKTIRKRYKKDVTLQKDEQSLDGTVEDTAHEVRVRFRMGCECQDDCCFNGLSPENVYRHRLNIAELTKEEHDMYLMGVTMACMADPGVTAKQRKRRRLRAQYVYQGRRVCLSAFLYLENCTLYQLKRIRKHVMTHGVAPRVHGNHGKKPHNVFPLDTYRRATEFFKSCIEKYNNGSSNLKSPILFPAEMTRKTIHNLYKEMVMDTGPPGQKIMGYSTFRHFMKEQFPQVRFCKQETGSGTINASNSSGTKHYNNNNNNCTNGSTNVINHQQTQQPAPPVIMPPQHQQHEQATPILTNCVRPINNHNHNADVCEQPNINVSSHPAVSSSITPNSLTHTSCPVSVAGNSILSSAQMTTIPVILSEPSKPDVAQQQTAFIVTPVSQLVQPFQAGHAITVTPLTNTAYAFATL